MFPGGQHATRIMPSATDGAGERISVRRKVTAGNSRNCAAIPTAIALGLVSARRKSSTEVSRAIPSMIAASTTLRIINDPGLKLSTTSSIGITVLPSSERHQAVRCVA